MTTLPEIDALIARLSEMNFEDKIDALNAARSALHQISPFKQEPVDCITWVKAETVQGNSYNPNTVAPPEMKLLELSIESDGYTQPVVTWLADSTREVVDGFHRTLVGQSSKAIKARTRGYLPVVTVNDNATSHEHRMASTIRHNRARGKHGVSPMAEIVAELARRNWNDEKIGKELGMEPDEVLRLKQTTGLRDLFSDTDFSTAWEIDEDALNA